MSTKTSSLRKAKRKAGARAPQASVVVTVQERQAWIAMAAYFLSERRQAAGESPDELRDWLDAERTYEREVLHVSNGHFQEP